MTEVVMKGQSSTSTKPIAGLAGSGTGILYLFVIKLIPSAQLQELLVYLSPSIGAITTFLWYWLLTMVANNFQDKKAEKLYAKIRETLLASLATPGISEEHQDDVRKKLRELDETFHSRQLNQMKSVTPISVDQVQKQFAAIGQQPK